MQLYTVHFTTKRIVTEFDAKGKVIGTYTTDITQTIQALPYQTTKQYESCDNYWREPYVMEPKSTRKATRSRRYKTK